MNCSKPLVVLAILGLSTTALAETKIKGTKSNTSYRGTCNTPACCIQNPGAPGCMGSQLKSQANLPRHPRDTGPQPPALSTVTTPVKPTPREGINNSKSNNYKESDTTINNSKSNTHKESDTTINNSKSNTRKEGDPAPAPLDSKNSAHATEKKIRATGDSTVIFKEAEPTPAAPVATTTTFNNSKSNNLREGANGHSEGNGSAGEKTTTFNNSKSNSFKEAEPTPRPPVATTTTFNNSKSNNYKEAPAKPEGGKNDGSATEKGKTINGSKSNNYKEAEPSPGVTPTPKPVTTTTINASKSNSLREIAPTPTPVPEKKSQGKEGSAERNKNLNSSRSN